MQKSQTNKNNSSKPTVRTRSFRSESGMDKQQQQQQQQQQ
eukprot:CAMPEP_0197472524 /NCGR_PEP_ID=MMETSP1309-20131121/3746_1 /TAXON_ID=464262 /ORGANISM="Genus nov. species nov., Strain RCC998" /LENGTH=39 /DNA_ID= /DNA_START= /DNA_END= /DNA_ORIENTATION=